MSEDTTPIGENSPGTVAPPSESDTPPTPPVETTAAEPVSPAPREETSAFHAEEPTAAPSDAASAALDRRRTATLPTAEAPAPPEEDFAAMLDSSLEARAVQEGQSVKGVIVAINPDVAFVDIGAKSEATMDIEELKDPEGDIEVEVGQTIEAVVVSSEGGLKLSRRLARGNVAREQIGEAYRSALPVEGRVEKAIKGGYEVRMAGQRAFCPASQMDIVRTTDPAVHEGKVYTFRIIEYKEGGRTIVLSRRFLLDEEAKKKAEEMRSQIVPGAVLPGRVVSVREYGAFVDLGGVQGLLHVSEMGYGRISDPTTVVRPGDEITVKVLRLDEAKGKISLGLKQLQEDPWSRVDSTYSVGQVREGKVVRLQDFGAFVELESGIEGLAHVSTFPPTGSPGGWKKTVPPGTIAQFEILTVDTEKKRIGVARIEEGSSHAARGEAGEAAAEPPRSRRPEVVPGARLTGKVERHESFGVFVFLGPGQTGLLPLSETGLDRGADIRKAFPIGSDIEIAVLEVDKAARRIRLSRKALLEAEEKATIRDYNRRPAGSSAPDKPQSVGLLGEKLKAALESRKK